MGGTLPPGKGPAGGGRGPHARFRYNRCVTQKQLLLFDLPLAVAKSINIRCVSCRAWLPFRHKAVIVRMHRPEGNQGDRRRFRRISRRGRDRNPCGKKGQETEQLFHCLNGKSKENRRQAKSPGRILYAIEEPLLLKPAGKPFPALFGIHATVCRCKGSPASLPSAGKNVGRRKIKAPVTLRTRGK